MKNKLTKRLEKLEQDILNIKPKVSNSDTLNMINSMLITIVTITAGIKFIDKLDKEDIKDVEDLLENGKDFIIEVKKDEKIGRLYSK